MMENLLKDYKWNNPDLKFIQNIQIIDRLKYAINNNDTWFQWSLDLLKIK